MDFGTQAFRDKFLNLANTTIAKRRTDPNHFGPEIRGHGERQARAIIKRGLQEFNLTKPQLASLPKSDWRKALIALAVKSETTMKLSWITDQLNMGATSGVSRYTAEMASQLEQRSEKKLKSHYKRLV